MIRRKNKPHFFKQGGIWHVDTGSYIQFGGFDLLYVFKVCAFLQEQQTLDYP